MRQTSSGKSVLHISLAYHNTQNTNPSNWYLSSKTLNIQCQQYQPRQQFHSKSYLLGLSWAVCFALQTILHIARRLLLIIVPAQRISIQSDQSGHQSGCVGASVTGWHSWAHWSLQNCPMESILESSVTGNAGLQDSDTSWGNRIKLTKCGLIPASLYVLYLCL